MNIGLVLSGGMAKGAYQIGALKAINDFIPLHEIKYISCASIGVLNGYAYATGNLKHAEEMWKNFSNDSTRLFLNQILRGNKLQQSITNICNSKNVLSSTFYCSLFDISHRNIIYKNLSKVDNSKIPYYLKASVAMPIYNRAAALDDTLYFDGAIVDNIPVFPLLKHNLDYVLCIYFDETSYKFENTCFDNKTIKITFPVEKSFNESLIYKQDKVNDMIQEGYNRTVSILSSILSQGYENLEHIYSTITSINNSSKNACLRITGDILVTNLNRITQKLTRKKII
ncbi:MAG: hypothetical protein E7270_08995 [Lachnospiraceae bacterium]|nr:hypothetical protein [Lachnospiraceae bacterium]